ncbi:hypothetical protein ACQJBY_010143 [Aegilops geniculata]
MAGEEGWSITGSMAAKDALAAGEEKRQLKPCNTVRKRKAETEDEKLRAAKRKDFYAKTGPSKKMTRLPREEVASILSSRIHPDRAPSFFKALKLQNPDLIPSPEEEMDKLKVKRYANARGYYEAVEEFVKFQAWVRSEYAKNGYVEVDEDYLAHRSEIQACSDRARDAAFRAIGFSHEAEDLKNQFRRRQ